MELQYLRNSALVAGHHSAHRRTQVIRLEEHFGRGGETIRARGVNSHGET